MPCYLFWRDGDKFLPRTFSFSFSFSTWVGSLCSLSLANRSMRFSCMEAAIELQFEWIPFSWFHNTYNCTVCICLTSSFPDYSLRILGKQRKFRIDIQVKLSARTYQLAQQMGEWWSGYSSSQLPLEAATFCWFKFFFLRASYQQAKLRLICAAIGWHLTVHTASIGTHPAFEFESQILYTKDVYVKCKNRIVYWPETLDIIFCECLS